MLPRRVNETRFCVPTALNGRRSSRSDQDDALPLSHLGRAGAREMNLGVEPFA